MLTFKHAYHYTSSGNVVYTYYSEAPPDLLLAIANNQAILTDDIHTFVKKNDKDHLLINAYILNFKTGEISFNMEIVKNIFILRFKTIRDAILKELDTEQLKCMTNPVKLARIENVKQQLRDLPILLQQSMVNCNNLVDLRHIIPPILTTYKEMI